MIIIRSAPGSVITTDLIYKKLYGCDYRMIEIHNNDKIDKSFGLNKYYDETLDNIND